MSIKWIDISTDIATAQICCGSLGFKGSLYVAQAFDLYFVYDNNCVQSSQ